jgi:predicted glycosyltransferase
VSQRLILTAEQSLLLTHIATTAKATLCMRMKSSAFLELERITHELALSAVLGDDTRRARGSRLIE